MYTCVLVACAVTQAKSYGPGCQVATCTTGWKVSSDNKCEANTCVCNNGVASSGAQCVIDGSNNCDSCNSGFKLSEDGTACDGTFRKCAVVKMMALIADNVWCLARGVYIRENISLGSPCPLG